MAYKASPQTLARAKLARSKMSAKIRARSGKKAPLSVKKASMKIKPTVRASATAYGATKGLAVGGEHGGSGNVAPQHGPVTQYTQDQIDAMNNELGIKQPSPEEKAKAVNLARFKALMSKKQRASERQFDVPTLQQQHDDLRDVHDLLHRSMDEEVELDEMDKSQPSSSRGAEGLALGKEAKPVKPKKVKSDALKILLQQIKGKQGVAEEVEQVDEEMNNRITKIHVRGQTVIVHRYDTEAKGTYKDVKHTNSPKDAQTLARSLHKATGGSAELVIEEVEQIDEAKKTKKEKLKALLYRDRSNVRKFGKGAGLTTAQKAAARRAIANEEVEQIDERNLENKKKKNNWVRGLGVKAAIRGDVPFDRGHSPLRSGREVLAREDIMNEQPKDAADAGEYDYEGDMAKSQLRSIMANSKRLHDMLEENTNLPEWVQSKITLAQDYIQTAASYMEAEMNEEVVTEAKGTVAVTPQEIDLAAHHGDPNRITYGDVIKARILNRRKKMGKK